MLKQTTLKSEISLKGVGLHTGQEVTITFKPAPINNGFTFVRVDLEGNPITVLKLRGKGSKERLVPIGSFAKSALDEYLVRIRPNLLTKSKSPRVETALFLNHHLYQQNQKCLGHLQIDPHFFVQ